MIRCVAYCRVSTNSKDQANSLENQRSYFQREINKNENYEFVGVYADKGISGTKLNRPEFDRMLYDAGLDIIEVRNKDKDNRKEKVKYVTIPSTTRQPKFDKILVKNTSRFARNILVEEILRDLRKNRVYVHFIDLDKCTENEDDITYIQIFQTFDERESRDRSKKVLFGMDEGAKRGIIKPGNNLYGYKYNKEENRLLVVNEEAEVINLIFNLYSQGYGFRRINNILTEKGIKTREGKEFCKSSLRRIVMNEKYIGLSIRRKYDTGVVFNKTTYPKIRPKEEWLTDWQKSPKIPAIISDELFKKCQDLMYNKVEHEIQKGIYRGTTTYAGLIYCGVCGSNYTSNCDRGRFFYNCKLKKLKGISACNNNNISVDRLEKALSEANYIRTLKSYKENYGIPLTYIKYKLEKKLKEDVNVNLLEECKIKIISLKEKNSKLLDLYMDKIISKEDLKFKKDKNDSVIEELEIKITEIAKPKAEIENDILDISNAIEVLNNLKIKDTYTQQEIFEDIAKIVVYPNKEIQVTYKTRYFVENLISKYNFIEVNSVEALLDTNLLENLNAWETVVNSEERVTVE